jgi:hypothetical protein
MASGIHSEAVGGYLAFGLTMAAILLVAA